VEFGSQVPDLYSQNTFPSTNLEFLYTDIVFLRMESKTMGDPVSLILAALIAGTAKTANDMVQDAYKGLKELIKRKFESKPAAQVILEEHEKDSETYEAPLKKNLTEVGADKDEVIINAAQKVMELADPEGSKSGKWNIDIQGGVKGFVGENQGTVNQTIS